MEDIVLRKLIILLAFAVAMASTQDTFAKSKGSGLEAALAPCVDVNIELLDPADCGTDTLTRGKAKITKQGDVKVVVVGGEPDVTYEVHYRSIDNSEEQIGELTTDSDGDGNLEVKGFYSNNDAGSGYIILRREEVLGDGMKDQFVTAFKVIGDVEDGGPDEGSSDDEEPDFEAGLIRCKNINRPVALNPDDCGDDKLQSGKVEIDHEDGDLEVKVNKAVPNVTYEVFYRPLSGDLDEFIGNLITDHKGNGELEIESFFNKDLGAVDIGSLNIVLRRAAELAGGMKDQFMSGFEVLRKRPKAMKAVFKSGLVHCIEVNQGTDPPTQLSNCGTDSLKEGEVVIDEKGMVRVKLVHAEPNTEYEVCYRPIDGSPEIDLEMVVKTNPAGNANKKKYWFEKGTVGSGNVVIKREGDDQFVTGFRVIK